jgi:hypothetical protein
VIVGLREGLHVPHRQHQPEGLLASLLQRIEPRLDPEEPPVDVTYRRDQHPAQET